MRNSSREKSIITIAPGHRGSSEGALWGVGIGGYIWSSSFSRTNGVLLHFHTTWLNPGDAHNRGYGFQLRCLSE